MRQHGTSAEHGSFASGMSSCPPPAASHSKPSFLKPAFDTTPLAPAVPVPAHSDGPDVPERPQTPMVQPADSRPPSSSGERSRALSQGYVKISEVESTKRLNDSLEQDNRQLEAQIAELLRRNLQLRDNISQMEVALGKTEEDDAEEHLEEEDEEEEVDSGALG
eukprot:TRINITY_DN99727_c0_g1_i1.p1 TRINITY_DN99727_c0_g1~~TRINITY_DN99727_c0_g1_i1.p1  ORF type:complete len:164 (+),score=40.18 TRINITY_DN99727_c0_g1_i1:57-548(+)